MVRNVETTDTSLFGLEFLFRFRIEEIYLTRISSCLYIKLEGCKQITTSLAPERPALDFRPDEAPIR